MKASPDFREHDPWEDKVVQRNPRYCCPGSSEQTILFGGGKTRTEAETLKVGTSQEGKELDHQVLLFC